jgi:hypothetical protein
VWSAARHPGLGGLLITASVARLTKAERHALRMAVRRKITITELELAELNPESCRVAMAEMRKRKFRPSPIDHTWTLNAHHDISR